MNELRRHWTLDPEVIYLNHGSFGACPRVVLEAQQELRERIEFEPVDFFVRQLTVLLDEARERLAAFLAADPAGLVAVRNATSAVNAVLRSLRFEPGDELLTTDHGYNACRNSLEFVAERWGARVVVATVPFPLEAERQVVEALVDRVGPRTRLALIDHVTSPTGMVLPVAEIVAALGDRGVETLIDGAHAPGMLRLELDRLGATYYTGNCHKWLCAPKGAGFLWIAPARRGSIRPLTISHGANSPRPGRSRLHDEFDWVGTDDPTPFLCVPRAIEFLGSLVDGGWPEIRRRNGALACFGRREVAAVLEVDLPCPESMLGSLAALPLPDGPPDAPRTALYSDRLQERLLREHRIEIPVVPWPAPPRRLIRLSAQLYNDESDYRSLAAGLRSAVRAC